MFLTTLHYIKEGAFPEEFCKEVIVSGEEKDLTLAKIQDGDQLNRKSKVSWLEKDNLEKAITLVVNEANEKSGWNFLLSEFEPLQFTVYNPRDHYDWHIDSHNKPYENGYVRKLSFTICLNDDYTGGDFEIGVPHPTSYKNKSFRFKKVFKKGTIIVFPSFLWHKVHPVISGTRKVLVGWIVGKPFV